MPVFALSPPTIARLTARRVGLFLFSSCAVCALAPSRQYYVVQLCSCMSPMLSLPQLPIVRGGIFDGTRGMNCTRMNGSRMLDSAGEDLYLLEQRSRCPACRSACPHWHQTGTDPQAPSRDGRSVVADAAENAADGCLPAHAEDVVLDRLVRGPWWSRSTRYFVITLVPIALRIHSPDRIGSSRLASRHSGTHTLVFTPSITPARSITIRPHVR